MSEDRTFDLLTQELNSLRIRVGQVEAELREVRGQTTNEETPPARCQTAIEETPPLRSTFVRGDRVRITNRVLRPANFQSAWDSDAVERERNATVTHTTSNQVWFITDNGTKTWRAHNNLTRTTTLE